MFRIDSSTAVAVMPPPAAAGAPGFFNQAAPGSGQTPTVVTADFLNMLQEELMSIVVGAGLSPDKADHAQVLAAIQSLIAAAVGTPLSAAAASDLLAGTNNTKFATALAIKQAMVAQALTDATTIAWNMNLGFRAKVTLGGNRTLGQPTNLQEGATGSLQVIQDATGGRTLAYAACWDFRKVGSPVLSAGAGKRDLLTYEIVDATAPVIIVNGLVAA